MGEASSRSGEVSRRGTDFARVFTRIEGWNRGEPRNAETRRASATR
jgi:hypothetical protein